MNIRLISTHRSRLKPALQILWITVFLLTASHAFAVRPGDVAPEFNGTDSRGAHQSLAQYRGKYVVLEWHNNGYPYTQKHYLSGNMERLQQKWTAKGVVWLTIISSAPGTQGYVTAPEENDYLAKMHAAPTAAILDPTSVIARLYEARTTPEMFVIDPQGRVIYEGAIDDHPTPDPADLAVSKNYVDEALSSAMNGKPVATPMTRPYGCSVKYAR